MNKLKPYFLFYLLALALLPELMHAQKVVGIIKDAKTGEALPLVNILYNKNTKQGTTTNFNGIFEISDYSDIGPSINISYIGYEIRNIPKAEVPRNGKTWNIKLTPSINSLNEIDLVAGENPAIRMVKNAIANRDSNNPKNYKSYKYLSYNKDVITFKGVVPADTLNEKDSIRAVKDLKASETRHLMMFESVTRKYAKGPNKSLEVVIGSKISGFKEPTLGTVPDGFQNFGFYENSYPLFTRDWLNPLSNNGHKKYIFILKDTLYSNGDDTTFIMDYLPKLGSNFDGLKGELQLNTNKWAIEYISAQPVDSTNMTFKIEQKYELIDGKHWFPVQLNFNYFLEKFPFRQTGALFAGKTFIDSIEINIPISDTIFSELSVDFDADAGKKTIDFWDDYRMESLDLKELNTYEFMDSIGDRYHLDGLLYATGNIYNGYITVSKFDVDMESLLAKNTYEGWRLGLGLYTNKHVSKDFKIGGYFGYGTRDKNWKYGGRAWFYFNKNIDNNLELNYKNDLRAPGVIGLRYWKLTGTLASQFFNTIMDDYNEVSAYINFRAFKYFQGKVGFKNFNLNPNYDYIYTPLADIEEPLNTTYGFAESYMSVRWVHKEIFKNNYGQRISEGSKFPVLIFAWSHGFDNIGDGQQEYNKYEFGLNWHPFTAGWGFTTISLEGGYIDRSVPYSINYNSRPSFKPGFTVVVPSTFQTMRFNEFTSSEYASLFLRHNFKSFLFKSKHFKPEFIIMHAMGIGRLKNPELHEGVALTKTMEKGFYESGIVVDNILRINSFNIGYFGIGAGGFYRYGPYQFKENQASNWAFKLSFLYTFN